MIKQATIEVVKGVEVFVEQNGIKYQVLCESFMMRMIRQTT